MSIKKPANVFIIPNQTSLVKPARLFTHDQKERERSGIVIAIDDKSGGCKTYSHHIHFAQNFYWCWSQAAFFWGGGKKLSFSCSVSE